MKKLLRLIVVLLGCHLTAVNAAKEDKAETLSFPSDRLVKPQGKSVIPLDKVDAFLRDLGIPESRLRADRQKYAAIKLAGGIIRRVGSDQIVGCRTPRDHEEHMNFIHGGDGKPSDFCWPIKEGTGVKLAPAYSAEFPQCTEEFMMCRFDPGWFGKSFYTLFRNVEPVE